MSDGEEWKGESEDYPSFFGNIVFKQLTPEQQAEYDKRLADRRAKGRMLAATLTRFRDDAKCPKCAHPKTRTTFCAGRSSVSACLDSCGDTEHLHRDCKRCGFTWYERPLDAEDTP